MTQADVERLSAAHRQPRERAMPRVRPDGVGGLDRGDEEVQQVALELREAGRVGLGEDAIRRRHAVVRQGPAIGHHHDHRDGLAVGDEVVQDGVGPHVAGPFVLVAADAVQQVEHRIAALARVAGRQIDQRLAPPAGDARLVAERLHPARSDAGPRFVEAPRRWRRRADIVGCQHDPPGKVGAGRVRCHRAGVLRLRDGREGQQERAQQRARKRARQRIEGAEGHGLHPECGLTSIATSSFGLTGINTESSPGPPYPAPPAAGKADRRSTGNPSGRTNLKRYESRVVPGWG